MKRSARLDRSRGQKAPPTHLTAMARLTAAPARRGAGKLAFMDVWYPIQVNQKERVGRPDIDAFESGHDARRPQQRFLRRLRLLRRRPARD